MLDWHNLDPADDMELTMGVRYVRERKVINADVCVSQDTLGISNCAGTTTNPYPVVQAILGSLYDTWAHEFYDIQRETDHWLPSIQLEKRLNENNMIYVSYSQGYKSGGFNAASTVALLYVLVCLFLATIAERKSLLKPGSIIYDTISQLELLRDWSRSAAAKRRADEMIEREAKPAEQSLRCFD